MTEGRLAGDWRICAVARYEAVTARRASRMSPSGG